MARCTKCQIVLMVGERSNITMDREVACGWKHKDCSKAIGKKELTEAPPVKPLPLKSKEDDTDKKIEKPVDVSGKNLKDKNHRWRRED